MSEGPGIVPGMFSGLQDVDWASMHHAYGSAEEVPALLEALRSPNPEIRHQALSDYYGKVLHQGSVYPSTTASLPFLLELGGDPATPGRAEIIELLVDIGVSAAEYADYDMQDPIDALTFLRAHAEAFAGFAEDPICQVRKAALPALGLLLDDADRALTLLQNIKFCLPERLLAAKTTATLAQRLPAVKPAATAWLAGLTGEPEFRLAAVIHRAACTPEEISDDVVPAALRLLREIADAAPPEQPWPESPPAEPPAAGVPPFVAAAFEDMARANRRHALTTDLLQTLHELLDTRVPQRTDLLIEQLSSPDPGVRLDAIRMTSKFVGAFRGDHSALIRHVAAQLGASNLEVAAEAATLLERHHQIAEPAREALAALLTADGWLSRRRLHQKATMASARLGDARALPSLLAALDNDVDAWLAVQVAGALPQAADQLAPRLVDRLRGADLSSDWPSNAILSALTRLAHPCALPVVTDTLAATAEQQNWAVVQSALAALRAVGPAAASALPEIRSVVAADDTWTRAAAVTTLWAVGGDRDEVLPLALALLDTYAQREAADVLGEIGQPAAEALPRLRELLTADYEWTRVHAAAAIWDISGEPEAVLETLLQAWKSNPSTGNHVAACLKRMGPAAAPALPQIRAELARPERGGWAGTIDNDQELLHELAAMLP